MTMLYYLKLIIPTVRTVEKRWELWLQCSCGWLATVSIHITSHESHMVLCVVPKIQKCSKHYVQGMPTEVLKVGCHIIFPFSRSETVPFLLCL